MLIRHREVQVEIQAVHAALVEAFRKHGIDARPLDHACRYGFLPNGDTSHYLRPIVLQVERHQRLEQQPSSSGDPMEEMETRIRYETTYAIALELSLYRQGGGLVL